MKDIVTLLNNLKITQHSIDIVENIPEDIYEAYFRDKYNFITDGIDVDKHRWYELSTTVFSLDGVLIGCNAVSQTYSEQTYVEDLYHTMEFFYAKEVQTITYERA